MKKVKLVAVDLAKRCYQARDFIGRDFIGHPPFRLNKCVGVQ
jgi:hypothetical protein